MSNPTVIATTVQQQYQQPNKPAALGLAVQTRNRVADLAMRREAWESSDLTRSNQILFGLLAECLALFLDLTSGTNIKEKKLGFHDYLNTSGITYRSDAPLTQKIILSVFGNKDRRRISTYHTVLQVAIKGKWSVEDTPKNIIALGGVQEASLCKSSGMSATEKAVCASESVLSKTIALIDSDLVRTTIAAGTEEELVVGLMTHKADGALALHCIVQSKPAVKATLASYYSKNKAEILKHQTLQAILADEKLTAELIAKAASEPSITAQA